MFDTYVTRQQPNYPQEVHVHRPPTDASAQLLRELEEKAKQHVICSGVLEPNQLSVRWAAMQNFQNDEVTLYFKFNLNGQEQKGEINLPRLIKYDLDAFRVTLMTAVIVKVASAVGVEFSSVEQEVARYLR